MGILYHILPPRFTDTIEEMVEKLLDPEVRMEKGKRVSYELFIRQYKCYTALLNSQQLRLPTQILYKLRESTF